MKKIAKLFGILVELEKYVFYFLYVKIKHINNDSVWLISERGTEARDNSYYLYRYIKKNHPEIAVKFVINKNSPDISKINSEDIVYLGSKQHYLLFLTSGYLISTHIMGASPNMSLFSRLDKHGLLKVHGKIIFIQHGIVQNKIDIEHNNFDLITSASKDECDFLKSLAKNKNSVKLLGLARYDHLKDRSNQKRQILFMPTFRKNNNFLSDQQFTKTQYYITIQNLLNNERLDAILRRNNLNLVFYPHYETQKRLYLFKTNSKNIIIASKEHYDVQSLLSESCLLITDYSSVHMDFAFMKKPIIYYQFDEKEFFSKHYKVGYYDYEKMGFGIKATTEKQVIELISSYAKNLFHNSARYLKRSERFFAFSDRKNCERTYKTIISNN